MKAGVVGYIITTDGRPVLGDFAETAIYGDWLTAVSAARAVEGQLTPVVAAPQQVDAPRRGRPRKEAGE